MRALLYLEARRIVTLAPVVGVMLIFGMAPAFTRQEQGETIGIAFLAMTSVVLVSRIFPFESTSRQVNVLVGTLPVTRRQVVAARYTLAMFIILASAILVTLIPPYDGLMQSIAMAGVLGAIPLLNLIVIGPLSSRGGLGQIGPMVPVLPLAVLVLLAIFMPASWKQALLIVALELPALSASLGLVLLAILLIASFLLSVRWFTKRDL